MARRIDPRLLGHRWSDSLAAQGIRALDDLTAWSEDELLGLHGIGPASLQQIVDLLWENDLDLVATEDPDDEPAEDDVEDEPTDTAHDYGTAVHSTTREFVRPFYAAPADAPFAAIAERLAVAVDETGDPYKARELRMTLGVLSRQPAPAADGEPTTGEVVDEDEVARIRRERQQRRA